MNTQTRRTDIFAKLQLSLLENRCHPVLLLVGKSAEAASSMAQDLLKATVEFGTDLLKIDREGERVKLEDANLILEHISVEPAGRWRVVLVHDVDRMTLEASNRLLKTLEEPPANVLFFLTSLHPRHVLPTIRSRSLTVPLPFEFSKETVRKRTPFKFQFQAMAEYPGYELAQFMKDSKGVALSDALQDMEVALGEFYRERMKANSYRGAEGAMRPNVVQRRRDLMSRLRYLTQRQKININTQLALDSMVAVHALGQAEGRDA